MNYSDRLKYIQKYLTNEMSSSEREVFATWLEEDGKNKILFEQLGGIWKNATYVGDDDFNFENAFQRHIAIINEEHQKPGKLIRLSFINLRSIAAILVLVLLSTIVFKWMNSNDSYKAVSESMIITLSDSSKVWLEEGSELEVFSFKDDSRKVHLVGRAFFEVTPNKYAPFVIQTEGIGVKVLGTKFLVDTKSSIVNVKEGKVEVKHKDEAIVLIKNQSVELKNNHFSELKESDFDESQLWFNEDLVFNNVTFDKVVSDICKEYKISIDLPERNSWNECLFTSGTLKGNTFDQILDILKVTYDLEYSKIDNDSYKFSKVNCK